MSVSIWDDPDFLEIAESAQRLYLMLVSFGTINNAGVLPMTLRRWARKGPKSTPESVRDDLQVLADARFIGVDDESEEVLVRTFIRNDGIASQPQMLTNGLRAAVTIESPHLRRMLAAELRRLGLPKADRTADILDPGSAPTPPPPPPAQPPPTLPEALPQPAGSLNGPGEEPGRSSVTAVKDSAVQAPSSLPAPCADPGGVGEGEGVGTSSVGKDLGGRARAREGAPPPPIPLRSKTGPVQPCGERHPPELSCWRCRDARTATATPPPLAERPFWS